MAELKQEIERQADISRKQLAALIESTYDYTRLKRGEIREATILSIKESQVIVDLGVKRDGLVPPNDLLLLDATYRDGLHEEQRVPVYVLNAHDDLEQILVSLNLGLAQQDWLRAKVLLESGDPFRAEAVHPNRGGMLVQFGRLKGFVPNSHLLSIPRGMRGEEWEQARADLIGKTLSLVVLQVDQKKRRLVFSERDARQKQRQQRLNELVEGEVCTGIVRNIVDFGAFVDLDGIDGLVHISELAWKHVNHPSEELDVGDEIEVLVRRVDRERERIALSRKRLLPDPWETDLETVEEGQVVEGKITSSVPFGVFVEIMPGIEGLIHLSEIPDSLDPESELGSGTTVRVRVVQIDVYRHRIALSLRDVDGVTDSTEAPILDSELIELDMSTPVQV